MSTKIRKNIKKYNRGISKAIPPSKTLQIIFKKINKLDPRILDTYSEIKSKAKIPQYIVMGTDYYMQTVNDMGRVQFSFNSNGKGHFKTEAQVSGMMEMAERYSCCKYLFGSPKKATTSSFKVKSRHYNLKDFYLNPIGGNKIKILKNREVESAKLLWYKVLNLDGQESYLPLSLISYTYQYSNGMAAGNTLQEAISHGICEVIERHCEALVQEKKLVAPTINQGSIHSPIIRELLGKFKRLNQKVILKDLSLDMGIPVIGAIRGTDVGRYFVTIGVAPNREEAVIRALIENSQIEPHVGPHIKHEEGWEKSSILHHFKQSKKVDYKDLPSIHNIDIKKEILSLEALLERQNMKIFYVDTTDPKLKIPSVIMHIINAKCDNDQIAYRNIIMGIIEESLRIKDYKQATKYIKLGIKLDPKNTEFYLFYKGLIHAFEKKYAEAINIFKKLPKKKLYEIQALIDIYIGICYLALGKLDKTFEHLINNIKEYPTVKFVFIRSHHCFDDDIFKNARELYFNLCSKLVITNYSCSPCTFVFK
jgi:ribosomal protein S12 methylthiotransferase accessory factor